MSEGTWYRGQRRWYTVHSRLTWNTAGDDTLFYATYHFLLRDFPGLGNWAELQRRREHIVEGSLLGEDELMTIMRWSLRATATYVAVYQRRLGAFPDSFPTRHLRLNGTLAATLRWRIPHGVIGAGVDLQYTEETNHIASPLQTPEVQQRRQQQRLRDSYGLWTQLSASAHSELGPRDSLAVLMAIGLLRYDTPSQQNTDDRDEQYLSLVLRYSRGWGQAISVSASMELQRRHTVFLQAPRSAWNHRLYVLAARWEGKCFMEHFFWRPRWELLANYTVRDYPYTTALQDISFRQWSYRDTIRFRIVKGWSGEIQLLVQHSTVGALDWRRFAEAPRSSVREYVGGTLCGWQDQRQRWGIGWRISLYRYAEALGGTILRREGIGPQALMELYTSLGKLSAVGWYELRRSTGQLRWAFFPWLSVQFQML
ncbi:MAG: hypothetical protein RMK93_03760 [Bacteroidota bacterium]|nr:hypothetical protein [Bacteroidota bacterium]